MAIKLGVGLIRSFSLSTIMGKKDFVIAPFVVLSHSFCHCLRHCSFSALDTVLFATLLQHSSMFLLLDASFARRSASSL